MLQRRNKSINSLAIMSLLVAMIAGLFLFTSLASASDEELAAVQQAIAEKGAQWTAGETSVSVLPKDQRLMRRGGKKSPVKPLEKILPKASASILKDLPSYLNYNEYGDVSPIEDQEDCGSCWAFGSTAALESQILMSSGILTDEAEQILLSCTDPTFVRDSCNGGFPSDAADFIKNTGLPPVSYFPYTDADTPCADAVSGWQSQTYTISSWSYVADTPTVDDLRAALYTYGPLVVWMDTYADFDNYKGGIYSYVTGKEEGAHIIELIGYDDTEQCFIVKNSWGTGWGEKESGVVISHGFFRIAYSENTGTTGFGTEAIAYNTGSQPVAATHFAVSAPSSAIVNKLFNFTVQALDANNNVATDYSGTVTFTTSDYYGWIPYDSTLVSGAGTFESKMETVGTQTLTATDTAGSSITGTSNPITVLGTLSISGAVTTTKGKAAPGVLIALSNGQTTTTNNTGKYTFSQLGSGTYTVVPSLYGHTFSPTGKTVPLRKSNVGGVNFKMK